MELPYIGPTLHEEPPNLIREDVSHDFRMCRHVRWIHKPFHDLRFSTINFDVGRGCAMGRIIGVGTTYIGKLSEAKKRQESGLQAGSGHL